MGRPPKDAFSEATVIRVMRAAEEAFGADGFRKARLSDVAAAAGIRRPSLLYHFESKARLYALVVDLAFAELRQTVEQAMTGGGTPPEALDRIVNGLLGFAQARRPLLAIILRELIDPTSDQVARAFADLMERLETAWRIITGDQMPPGAPARTAITHLVAGYLVRAASGELGDRLWGPDEHVAALARRLLLP